MAAISARPPTPFFSADRGPGPASAVGGSINKQRQHRSETSVRRIDPDSQRSQEPAKADQNRLESDARHINDAERRFTLPSPPKRPNGRSVIRECLENLASAKRTNSFTTPDVKLTPTDLPKTHKSTGADPRSRLRAEITTLKKTQTKESRNLLVELMECILDTAELDKRIPSMTESEKISAKMAWYKRWDPMFSEIKKMQQDRDRNNRKSTANVDTNRLAKFF